VPELWQASVLDWTASEEADQISPALNARGVWTSVKGLSWGGAERLIFAWGEAIAAARAAFARCQFDEAACELGLRQLRAYRKEWDEGRGVWRDRPRHDDASHGADAFLYLPLEASCRWWDT